MSSAVSGVRTGVAFRPTTPPERLREVVQAAEAAGVDELWVWEDCFAEGGLSSAALALAWSTELRIGAGLLPVGLRNPGLLAMEIATLARVFPGRFLPGLGHVDPGQRRRAGEQIDSPMTLLREHAAAVRDLLHGRRADVVGRYVHLDDVTLDWPPPEPPPLLMGARGPKTLRLAGELADGVVLDSIETPAQLRSARGDIEIGRAGVGRTDPFLIVVYVEPPPNLAIDQLTDLVAEHTRELAEAGATSVVFVNNPHAPDPLPLIRALDATRRGG